MKHLGFDLILLGDPASGKDTQARLIARKYAVKLAGSGEYLRKFKRKQYVSGGAAPSKLILDFLDYTFRKSHANRNLVFVGAARLKSEAQYLVQQLEKRKRDFYVLYIRLPKREIIKRSKIRSERSEDKDLNLIKRRIDYHDKLVSKTVDYYLKMHKLQFIDGRGSIKKVEDAIQRAIDGYQKSKRN